jgi:hypothetical protein
MVSEEPGAGATGIESLAILGVPLRSLLAAFLEPVPSFGFATVVLQTKTELGKFVTKHNPAVRNKDLPVPIFSGFIVVYEPCL